jgi:hypothetical protein
MQTNEKIAEQQDNSINLQPNRAVNLHAREKFAVDDNVGRQRGDRRH